MTDVVDRDTRSRMMAGIRGANTRPELALRRGLHAAGFRYRLHASGLPGRPDLLLPRHRAAVFVHGCFWHRHEGCHWCTTPATRADFWADKFAKNVSRDRQTVRLLHEEGWRVGIIWECALRVEGEATVEAVSSWLRTKYGNFETELVRPRGAALRLSLDP